MKYFDYELIEAKDRELANEEHKDEMNNFDNEAGADRADNDSGQLNPELRDAKIDCTVDIFLSVVEEVDEEQARLRQFTKFQDIFQIHNNQIEDYT